jgi:hypothetical protein
MRAGLEVSVCFFFPSNLLNQCQFIIARHHDHHHDHHDHDNVSAARARAPETSPTTTTTRITIPGVFFFQFLYTLLITIYSYLRRVDDNDLQLPTMTTTYDNDLRHIQRLGQRLVRGGGQGSRHIRVSVCFFFPFKSFIVY